MKYILPLVLMNLLLAACTKISSDDTVRRQIVGTWTIDNGSDVWTLSPDGGFNEKWARAAKALAFQGTWQVTNGILVATITNKSSVGFTNVAAVGSAISSHIVRLDSDHLTLVYDSQTNHWLRKP
ncbi:MAG: hypothetical protein WCS94_02700 [Verrucomicrobiota bacterium]